MNNQFFNKTLVLIKEIIWGVWLEFCLIYHKS